MLSIVALSDSVLDRERCLRNFRRPSMATALLRLISIFNCEYLHLHRDSAFQITSFRLPLFAEDSERLLPVLLTRSFSTVYRPAHHLV
jgi:hypothetical protein